MYEKRYSCLSNKLIVAVSENLKLTQSTSSDFGNDSYKNKIKINH